MTRHLLIATVLVAGAANAAAQTTATISGTLTDATTSAPLVTDSTSSFVVYAFRADGTNVGDATDAAGHYQIELERIEVNLAADVSAACAPTYAGYHVANGELRALPAGASLDRASGMFYWQPGAGFVGTYELVFVRTTCDGRRSIVPLHVTIGPLQ